MMKDIDLSCDAEIALSVFKDVEFEHKYEKNLEHCLDTCWCLCISKCLFLSFCVVEKYYYSV